MKPFKPRVTLLIASLLLIFSETSNCVTSGWKQIIYPDQKIQDLTLNPSNPDEMAVSWKQGIGISRDGGRLWRYSYQRIRCRILETSPRTINLIAGLDLDIASKPFKPFFLLYFNEKQRTIAPHENIYNFVKGLKENTVITHVFPLPGQADSFLVTSALNAYICRITTPFRYFETVKNIQTEWRVLPEMGEIKSLCPISPDHAMVFSKPHPADNGAAAFSLYRLSYSYGPKRIGLFSTDAPELLNELQLPPIQARRYYYQAKDGIAFFSNANQLLYSTNYAHSFNVRNTIQTVEGDIIQVMFVTGHRPGHLIILGNRIKKNHPSNQLGQLADTVPNGIELDTAGKAFYSKAWTTMTDSEKQAWYLKYLKKKFPQLNEGEISYIIANPNLVYDQYAVYELNSLAGKCKRITFLPRHMPNVANAKIYLAANDRDLYLVNQGVWKLHVK